jgi:Tol biopolymer transport system component
MPLREGSRFGPYEVLDWLGAGGMGTVYRARDSRFERTVAIKLLPEAAATDTGRARRFEQEARAAGQLNHPNVLAVYDVGVHDGTPYLVSELLEGETLRSRLQGGALAARKALDYARQIAEGLAAAHAKGIVHRDLKPDNLFVTSDGRVKILDFGIAKLTRPHEEPAGRTAATETEAGIVMGTAGYMSPEQVRGDEVDARSDIFSFGTILYEMLSGRSAFSRGTSADTMAAILKEDPPATPSSVSPGIERIVSRCLEKSRDARFQSARDLAFALDVLSGTSATAPRTLPRTARPWRSAPVIAAAALSLLVAAAIWLTRTGAPAPAGDPLANARFSRFTDWEGTEGVAEISPDGRFVAFLADREGEFDLFVSQVGTGNPQNLTAGIPPMAGPSSVLRRFGFTGDGSEIFFTPSDLAGPGEPHALIPLTGGTPRPFLQRGDNSPSWSPDTTQIVYFHNGDGDDLFVADGTGANARAIVVNEPGFFEGRMHNHNPVWSPDGQWIYFVHGAEPSQMDVWRVRPSGEALEQLTSQQTTMNFLAPIDARTLLYVARAEDQSGPWLWSLDVETKETRRVTSGLERYSSVSASRDGRRVVATRTDSALNLWTVPLLDRLVEDRDVKPYRVERGRAFAPRFGGESVFFLSARGAGDGLWRFLEGRATEIWRSADDSLTEPPAVSPDGNRVAIVARVEGKWRLTIMTSDGTSPRSLAPTIEVQTSGGQGTIDWSPDGTWIVTAGADAHGQGLFKVPVDGGEPVRLVSGPALNPVWSPDGRLIVYAGQLLAGQVPVRGVRPDGTPVKLPELQARIGGGYRFLPNSKGLVYLPHNQALDFSLLDLEKGSTRVLTRLSNQGLLHTFDITPDGKQIVFDRSRENSDIVLIDLK